MTTKLIQALALTALVAGCTSNVESPAGATGGGGQGAGTSSTTTTSGTGGTVDTDCPAELPAEGGLCEDGLDCEYPDSECSTRAVCRPDAQESDITPRWIHLPPHEGTACAEEGRSCTFEFSGPENDITVQATAICTSDGWGVVDVWCSYYFEPPCGNCPVELPAAGDPCSGNVDLGHCAYPYPLSCGTYMATLDCVDGGFVIQAPSCE